jgi:hypothetical protein
LYEINVREKLRQKSRGVQDTDRKHTKQTTNTIQKTKKMSNITTEKTEMVQIAYEGLSVPGKGL